MHLEKRWRLKAESPAESDALARTLGVTRVTAQLLLHRGILGADAGRTFLKPDLNDLHDPSEMPEMEQAAQRICEAVRKKERIAVYGDYDADGITATAILMRAFRLLEANAIYYVPDRFEEGYGVNEGAIRKLAADGTRLLITVDCGISAAREVAVAIESGMEVIVTDHHEPGDLVPTGAILINPKLPGCTYPFRELAGAGVAFKLAWAIGKEMAGSDRVSPPFREFLMEAISFAALGTIADVVPLLDENRTLTHFGLRMLGATRNAGITALRESAGLNERELEAFDVAFKLAPRLNAAGRMGSARAAIELLTTDDTDYAREIAAGLNNENSRRQKMQEKILEEARAMIAAGGGVAERRSIVLAGEGWHAGVIGIVAARLADEYYRPTVLLTLEGDEAHGSARSIAALHLFETLHECAGRLTAYGGHARAAGLRMRRGELEAFQHDFEKAAASRLTPEDLVPVLDLDAEVRLEDVTRPLIDEMARLQPFGEGNGEPLLAARNLAVPSEVRRMGSEGKHLSFYVRSRNGGNSAFRAVAFGKGFLADRLTRAGACSIAFTPRLNHWRGNTEMELGVRDIQLEKNG